MKNKRGFTLIETVAAMGLCALIILVLVGAFNNSLSMNTYSKSRLTALNDARAVAEQVRRAADSVGLTGAGSVTNPSVPWNKFISNSLPNENVQVTTSGTNPLDVTITVSWKEKDRNENLRLVTKVTKR